MTKRNKFMIILGVIALIEIIYFYFMGRRFNFVNHLDNSIAFVFYGMLLLAFMYYVLLDTHNLRKKNFIFGAIFLLLVIAPIVFQKDIPKTTFEEAQQLIVRTESGKAVKDREYQNTIVDYDNNEVYLIAIEKKKKMYRYAFNPYTQQYYPFSN